VYTHYWESRKALTTVAGWDYLTVQSLEWWKEVLKAKGLQTARIEAWSKMKGPMMAQL
jgi:hypothetical protein